MTAAPIPPPEFMTPATVILSDASRTKVYDGTTGIKNGSYTWTNVPDDFDESKVYGSASYTATAKTLEHTPCHRRPLLRAAGIRHQGRRHLHPHDHPQGRDRPLHGERQVYDGTTAAAVTGSSSGHHRRRHRTFSQTADFDDKNAGTGKSIHIADISLTARTAATTRLRNSTATASADITPAPLTVTANDDRKLYDGAAYSGGNGVTYAGFANGEDSSVLGGLLAYGGSSQGAVQAGTYGIDPSGLTSNNYDLRFVNGTLTGVAVSPPDVNPSGTVNPSGAIRPPAAVNRGGEGKHPAYRRPPAPRRAHLLRVLFLPGTGDHPDGGPTTTLLTGGATAPESMTGTATLPVFVQDKRSAPAFAGAFEVRENSTALSLPDGIAPTGTAPEVADMARGISVSFSLTASNGLTSRLTATVTPDGSS